MGLSGGLWWNAGIPMVHSGRHFSGTVPLVHLLFMGVFLLGLALTDYLAFTCLCCSDRPPCTIIFRCHRPSSVCSTDKSRKKQLLTTTWDIVPPMLIVWRHVTGSCYLGLVVPSSAHDVAAVGWTPLPYIKGGGVISWLFLGGFLPDISGKLFIRRWHLVTEPRSDPRQANNRSRSLDCVLGILYINR